MNVHIARISDYLDWMKQKIFLDQRASSASKRIVFRGQVYKCNLGKNIGSEQEKERPCVVLQNDSANKNSGNTIVAPISHSTSTIDVVVPITTITDQNGSTVLDGAALLGNIVTVSKARLGDLVAKLSPSDMKKIDLAIIKSTGLLQIINTKDNIIKDRDAYIEKLKGVISELESNLQGKVDGSGND